MTDKAYAEYTRWQIPFKEMFSHYYGEIESKVLGQLVFTNKNILTHHGEQKKAECRIVINQSYIVDPKRYSVSADERTLEIIGGQSCGDLTKEEALNMANRMLEKYCFKHKEMEQISLL